MQLSYHPSDRLYMLPIGGTATAPLASATQDAAGATVLRWIAMGILMNDADVSGDMADALRSLMYPFHEHATRHQCGLPTLLDERQAQLERGRAVVATTVVLSAQFLLMALSAFQPTAAFGLLKGLEDQLLFIRRNTDTRIGNADPYRPSAIRHVSSRIRPAA